MDACSSRYSEALLALASELVNRVQFRTNRAQLQKLDDASVDDDDETEWQQYLRVCIETVMKVSDLLPTDVLRIVYMPWKETSQVGLY